MTKIKTIIDCDTGIDDTLAIAYLLANPDADLLGITATFGNISVDTSVRNTLNITAMLGRKDIKVYRGAEHGWNSETYHRHPILEKVHGGNGIGNIELGEPDRATEEMPAVDFIVESAKQYGSELHLIFVGPLTNFAECVKKDEEAMRSVRSITIMGGALTVQGNRDAYSEANIQDDPVAAKYVFGSSLHINVVPLDATLRTMFRLKDIIAWKDMNQAARSLYQIAGFYYAGEYGDDEIGGAMHDPLAAFASIDPSIITNWYDCNLTVEPDGRTIGAFEELNLPEKRHRVALDVDSDRFTSTYVKSVTEMLEKL